MNPVRFDLVGELVRDHVDGGAQRSAHAILRARLVEAATERRPRPLWRLAPAGFAFAAAAAFFVWFYVKPLHNPNVLSFTVGTEQARGELGSYVAPVGDAEIPVTFSDGSIMRLSPLARARVVRTASNGASMILETGRATFDVVHREGNDWNVSAGPYTVHVTGTAFHVVWNPGTSSVEVAVQRGSVVVRGPGAESGVAVRTSQRFVSSAVTRVEEHADAASPNSDNAAAGQGSGASPISVDALPLVNGAATPPALPAPAAMRGAAGTPVSPSAPAVPATDAPGESWAALVAHGDYRRVLDSAEHRGIEDALHSVSASDLSALADAARFTGNRDLARRALTSVRSRFAGSEKAVSAAYLLGRVTEDLGRPKGAVEWYDRYLAEAPSGPLAPEAMGRRMLALQHSGDTDGYRRAAADYLKRFPNGPYAGIARDSASP